MSKKGIKAVGDREFGEKGGRRLKTGSGSLTGVMSLWSGLMKGVERKIQRMSGLRLV